VISHEHFDHFWGIGSTLRHCPNITLYIPDGFDSEGLALIKEQGHLGELIKVPPGEPLSLLPRLAVVNFPTQTLLQVDSENVFYAQIRDQGMAMMTGCGHGGVLDLLDYARHTFQDGDRIFALYGGLHIPPLEDRDESRDQVVKSLGEYGIAKLVCNHCTGRQAAQKMLEAGLPLTGSTAHNGSQHDLFVGNGDLLELA
jgi:7,8-dihydropterin-6-yl-methyl-4-(beta-D-ribofuranosyl)aminobenzene 5'-phosphate synthase